MAARPSPRRSCAARSRACRRRPPPGWPATRAKPGGDGVQHARTGRRHHDQRRQQELGCHVGAGLSALAAEFPAILERAVRPRLLGTPSLWSEPPAVFAFFRSSASRNLRLVSSSGACHSRSVARRSQGRRGLFSASRFPAACRTRARSAVSTPPGGRRPWPADSRPSRDAHRRFAIQRNQRLDGVVVSEAAGGVRIASPSATA